MPQFLQRLFRNLILAWNLFPLDFIDAFYIVFINYNNRFNEHKNTYKK